MTEMTRDKIKMLRRVLDETFANHEDKYKDYAITVGNASNATNQHLLADHNSIVSGLATSESK